MINSLKNVFRIKKQVPTISKLEEKHICPYCFEELTVNDVVFRATKGVYENDSKLAEFKQEVLDSDNSQVERRKIIEPTTLAEEDKEYDENGFLIRVKGGPLGDSGTKLCPFCHNTLPSVFGEKPAKIIAIYGPTSVGKTVYLTMLIELLQTTVAKEYNLSIFDKPGEEQNVGDQHKKYLALKQEGPDATVTNVYLRPQIYDFKFNDTKESFLLSIFDFPGEAAFESEYMGRLNARQFDNCDGLLILLEPKGDNNRALISSLINKRGIAKKPTAVVISKSDKLMGNELPENSLLFLDTTTLNLEAVSDIHTIMSEYLDEYETGLKNQLTGAFEEWSGFAVSSLGNDLNFTNNTNTAEYVYSPMRVCEPFLWLLQKSGCQSLFRGE